MDSNHDAEYWIENLNLRSHPEGGFYSETYRSEGSIPSQALVLSHNSARNYATSIYFLLKSSQCSKLHKILSDEVWYYHAGDSVNVHFINDNGSYEYHRLGPKLEKGERLQLVIPKNTWFGASIDNLFGYSLFGCMVAPGFDFNDFELANREELLERYPEHSVIIKTLT